MLYYVSWGTQTIQALEGIAADFCPICRRAAAIEVYQLRSQSHVYHIGLGSGTIVGRLCQCMTCRAEWALQPNTLQTSLQTRTPVSLETLLAETFPHFSRAYEERLRLESIVAADPFQLNADERLALIAEPFWVLENELRKEENVSSGRRSANGFGCLGAMGAVIGVPVAFACQAPIWGLVWLVTAIGLGWLTGRSMLSVNARFMRTAVYPRLIASLAPLRPSEEELTQVLTVLSQQSKCASRTKLPEVMPLLEQACSTGKAAQAAR